MRRDAVVLHIEKRWIRMGVIVLVTAAIAYPMGVRAGDRFDDVPSSNVFHDNIAWLADTGVTKGCNPPANTQFCPDAPVTRQQMAAFLQRLAESGAVDAGSVNGLLGTDLVTVGEFDKPTGVTIPSGSVWTDVATYQYQSGTFLFGGGALLWLRADLFNTTFTETTVVCELVPLVGTSGETQVDVAGATDGDEVGLTLLAMVLDPNEDDATPATATLRCLSTSSPVDVSNVAIVSVRADFLFSKAVVGAGSSGVTPRNKQP